MEVYDTIKEVAEIVLDKNSVLFSTYDEYVDFLRKLGFLMCEWNNGGLTIMNRTKFRCIEDIEWFFGISFGEDGGNGNVDINNIIIANKNRFPSEFPCLMITCCLECITDGNSQVPFMDKPYFIYQSDFTKKD